MHVCTMANARATIGGPLRSALLFRTSCSAATFQSLTTVAHAEVAHTSAATKVATEGNVTGRGRREVYVWRRGGGVSLHSEILLSSVL